MLQFVLQLCARPGNSRLRRHFRVSMELCGYTRQHYGHTRVMRLENRRVRKSLVSSNLTLSAIKTPLCDFAR
jgi:hypothetical protein